jgi:ATP-dependent RNA helicase DeaD
MNLENIPLSEKTKKNLCQIGYHQLTNIQLQTIPPVLEGRDIIAQSQTGTGKTAAFLIPILEKLEVIAKPQVLILVPTRELALQVSENARKLSPHPNLRVLAIYGQDSIREQSRSFRHGVDVVVGTVGRTIDHIFDQKTFCLDYLKFVVLDEVHEMINKGFLKDVEKIMKRVPKKCQILLFSATVPPQVGDFAKRFLKNPKRITAENNEKGMIGKIQHYYIETTSSQKKKILIDFLSLNKPKLTLVFANTIRKVKEIKDALTNENLKVDCIHGNLSQPQRFRVFDKFRGKRISLLIATDVAAQGLDIENISYVVNYDFPQNNDFYIHRVGRTGRAGASGKALTLINKHSREKDQLSDISRERNFKVERFTNQP